MFDSIGSFSRMFVPFEDGYLYYPSRRSGGKFVTAAEFDTSVSEWRRIAGFGGIAKLVGIMVAAAFAFLVIADFLALPSWADEVFPIAISAALCAWLLRRAFSVMRFVRNREPVTAPRSVAESGRATRSLISWRMVIGIGLISGLIFVARLTHPEQTASWWMWLIGSGLMFGAYLLLGWRKLRDRSRG